MTDEDKRAIRQHAAQMIRDWAERRLLSTGSGGPTGQRDRIYLTKSERELFEDCADDIERGLP